MFQLARIFRLLVRPVKAVPPAVAREQAADAVGYGVEKNSVTSNMRLDTRLTWSASAASFPRRPSHAIAKYRLLHSCPCRECGRDEFPIYKDARAREITPPSFQAH